MSYWIIEHGDRERPGLYWCGYVGGAVKDHTFKRDRDLAIRFCRRVDAENAGLNLERYKPIFVEVTDEVTSPLSSPLEHNQPPTGFPLA